MTALQQAEARLAKPETKLIRTDFGSGYCISFRYGKGILEGTYGLVELTRRTALALVRKGYKVDAAYGHAAR